MVAGQASADFTRARRKSGSVLLLFSHPLFANAPTIREHVISFKEYSRYKIITLNVRYGFPRFMRTFRADAIILHYSLFGTSPFQLSAEWRMYLKTQDAPIVAFFQDEHQHCHERVALIRELKINAIFSLLEPDVARDIYSTRTGVGGIYFTLTGFVSDQLLRMGQRYGKPWDMRTVDVGYRGRPLSLLYGMGGQEKTTIAREFVRHAAEQHLRLDIETTENQRLYGREWYKFVGNCRFMLGVEAGVSVFDLDDQVTIAVRKARKHWPAATIYDLYPEVIAPFEGNVPYRTVSPRIFEAIALRTGLVLYDGDYNGVVRPYEHYIPLRKDHSNMAEVFRLMADTQGVQKRIDRAYRDVIASNRYHYRGEMARIDTILESIGMRAAHHTSQSLIISKAALGAWSFFRHSLLVGREPSQIPFPGRRTLVSFARRYRLISQSA